MNSNILFFYDFETNGINPLTCAAMQLAIIDQNGDILKNQYIFPYDNKIAATEIHGIDENKLKENNGLKSDEVFNDLINWVNNIYPNQKILWIAYNNFGYDQIVMESHLKRVNKKVPENWYFLDLFPMVKEYFQNIKPNYKLKTVYEFLCSNSEPVQYHCALADSICLYRIYKKLEEMKIDSIFLNKYIRKGFSDKNILNSPLSGLGGYNYKMDSIYKKIGFIKIGDVYKRYNEKNNNMEMFRKYLKEELKIYSEIHNKNFTEQMNYIYYFSSFIIENKDISVNNKRKRDSE